MSNAQRKSQFFPATIDMMNKPLVSKILSDLLFSEPEFTFKDIAAETRLHPRTISNLAYGITKSPHCSTVGAVAAFYGYKTTMWR